MTAGDERGKQQGRRADSTTASNRTSFAINPPRELANPRGPHLHLPWRLVRLEVRPRGQARLGMVDVGRRAHPSTSRPTRLSAALSYARRRAAPRGRIGRSGFFRLAHGSKLGFERGNLAVGGATAASDGGVESVANAICAGTNITSEHHARFVDAAAFEQANGGRLVGIVRDGSSQLLAT